jgi:hypothetical protein
VYRYVVTGRSGALARMRNSEDPGSGEFDGSMEDYVEGGNVSEALSRLQSADLMPLIYGLEAVECVEITTAAELTAELQAQISQVLSDIRHHVVQVPHGSGIDYR